MLNKYELIQDMLKKCDQLADARGVMRCALLCEIVNQLQALSGGMKKEDEANQKKIELMKAQINQQPVPVEDGGDVIGGETYNIDFTEG